MSKGHRSKYKRLRNESKDSRPRAVLKNIRISDTKARIVLNQIKGKVTTHALAMLNYSTRYASRVIAKLLKSAMSNAENNLGLDPNSLYIEHAVADRALIMRRIQPRSKGRAYRIQKRFCHITLILNENLDKKIGG